RADRLRGADEGPHRARAGQEVLSRSVSALVTFVILGALLMSTPAHAQDRTVVTLGTATPGGGFPVYGQAFAEAIQATDPTLEIQQRNTKGSTENVPMLERGELDLALVQGEVVHETLGGVGRAPANLRILTAMYST